MFTACIRRAFASGATNSFTPAAAAAAAIKKTAAARQTKTVAVLGAAGGIGQPLALLLKQRQDLIAELRLYDIANVAGVAVDLSHVNTRTKTTAYTGQEQISAALSGCDLVVVPAGVPRKPGMSRDDLFNTNAGIVYSLAASCAENCPNALFLVISNPVNSTVPIFVESLRRRGVLNPEKRVLGVTSLDSMRAATFLAEAAASAEADPFTLNVPVIGGHSGPTIVPLLSRTTLGAKLSPDALDKLVHRIQYGGDEVVKAKNGAGSATLSMSVAGARTAIALLSVMVDSSLNITQPAYVACEIMKKRDLEYFASSVTLGPEGVRSVAPIGELSQYEKGLLEKCIPELKTNIERGLEFVDAK